MSSLPISFAVGDYDRNRALFDGRVQIDGVDPVFMRLEPEEIFFRAFRHQEFDCCEISFSSHVVSVAKGIEQYVAIPAFLSRAFRHSAIYIRTDRGIDRPEDLKDRKIGIAEYQLTANVWARALLEDDHGVKPSDIRWIRGGMETADRPEKITLDLPADVSIEPAPAGKSLNDLLVAGEIDGFVGPRALSCFDAGHPDVGRLFADVGAASRAYYERTKIFPIMHLLGLRKSLAEAHPWLPGALFKAFEQSRQAALKALNDTAAAKVTLPFVEDYIAQAKTLMGANYWSYGVQDNHHVIDNFLDHHHKQGLSERRVTVEELFHPGTLEAFAI